MLTRTSRPNGPTAGLSMCLSATVLAAMASASLQGGEKGSSATSNPTVEERLMELGLADSVVDTLARANLLSARALRLATPSDLVAAGLLMGDALVIAHELGSRVSPHSSAAETAKPSHSPTGPTGLPVLVTDHGATGDGRTDDLAAILRAVDAALSPGGARCSFAQHAHARTLLTTCLYK